MSCTLKRLQLEIKQWVKVCALLRAARLYRKSHAEPATRTPTTAMNIPMCQ
jgi:hypothetical protein